MEKWICKVCGYTHLGDEAPERCPKCGNPKFQFYTKRNIIGKLLSLFVFALILTAILLVIFGCSKP